LILFVRPTSDIIDVNSLGYIATFLDHVQNNRCYSQLQEAAVKLVSIES